MHHNYSWKHLNVCGITKSIFWNSVQQSYRDIRKYRRLFFICHVIVQGEALNHHITCKNRNPFSICSKNLRRGGEANYYNPRIVLNKLIPSYIGVGAGVLICVGAGVCLWVGPSVGGVGAGVGGDVVQGVVGDGDWTWVGVGAGLWVGDEFDAGVLGTGVCISIGLYWRWLQALKECTERLKYGLQCYQKCLFFEVLSFLFWVLISRIQNIFYK